MSGYSFKVEGESSRGSADWIPGSDIFTTPEFQRRYDFVRISLLTPKCTLVPEQFFDKKEAGRMLADVVRTGFFQAEDGIRDIRFPD